MSIDIDHLSENELIELNHRIVERLKFLETVNTHNEMMAFRPGEKVCFEPPGRALQFGTLFKFNKKTVTVVTESGQRWNVSPHLLKKVKDVNNQSEGNVVGLPRKT